MVVVAAVTAAGGATTLIIRPRNFPNVVDAAVALNPSIPIPSAPMKRRLTPPLVALVATAVAIPPIADKAVDKMQSLLFLHNQTTFNILLFLLLRRIGCRMIIIIVVVGM